MVTDPAALPFGFPQFLQKRASFPFCMPQTQRQPVSLGETTVRGTGYIDRGYERLERMLGGLGARIKRHEETHGKKEPEAGTTA